MSFSGALEKFDEKINGPVFFNRLLPEIIPKLPLSHMLKLVALGNINRAGPIAISRGLRGLAHYSSGQLLNW